MFCTGEGTMYVILVFHLKSQREVGSESVLILVQPECGMQHMYMKCYSLPSPPPS